MAAEQGAHPGVFTGCGNNQHMQGGINFCYNRVNDSPFLLGKQVNHFFSSLRNLSMEGIRLLLKLIIRIIQYVREGE